MTKYNTDQRMGSIGFTQFRVHIVSIDSNNNAQCIDQYKRLLPLISVKNMSGSGALPQVGEEWMVSRDGGSYTFVSRVLSNPPTVSTLTDVVNALQTLGFVTSGNSIVPITAEVSGVIKEFAGINLPSGYLWADWSQQSRTTYATLWNALSVQSHGNTHGTTTVDGIPAADVLKMMPGMPCCGTNIPANTTISAILSTTSVQISSTASGSATGGSFIVAPHGVGDGSTTFNLPDGRGKTPIGAGSQQWSMTYPQQVINLSPIGFWGLNESSGTVATDASTTANNGTYSGGFTLGAAGPLTSMPLRTGTTFNGSTGVVTVPYNAAYDSSKKSLELWMTTTNLAANAGLFEKSAGNAVNTGFLMFYTGNQLYWRMIDSVAGTHDVVWAGWDALSTNTWYHIVGTYDQVNSNIYVNGTLVSTAATGALTLKTGSGNTLLGELFNGWFHPGNLANVTLYNYALTQQEILANYRVGVPFVLGQTGGEEGHTLTLNELYPHSHPDSGHNHGNTGTESAWHQHASAAHNHTISFSSNNVVQASSSENAMNAGTGFQIIGIGGAGTASIGTTTPGNVGNQNALHVHAVSNASALSATEGNQNAHNNLGPYMPVNYIVKT